jgi:hypothetical protein
VTCSAEPETDPDLGANAYSRAAADSNAAAGNGADPGTNAGFGASHTTT